MVGIIPLILSSAFADDNSNNPTVASENINFPTAGTDSGL